MAILNFPPTAGEPIDGSFTYTSDGVTYSWDGYKWTADTGSGGGGGDANHTDGPTPPTTGELADQWYNTDDGRLYTYTEDSSGTLVWIDASPDSIAGGSGGGGGNVTTAYYNSASAWGRFSTTGGVLNSLNVKEITKVGTGQYQVEFTTPMASSFYAVNATTTDTAKIATVGGLSETSFTVKTYSESGVAIDSGFYFAAHSENAIAPQSGVGADAWGTFDGSSGLGSETEAILNAFNIKRFDRTSEGKYTVTFIVPMPSINYGVTVSTNRAGVSLIKGSRALNSFQLSVIDAAGDNTDATLVSLVVHASSTITPTYTWTRDETTLKPANDGDEVDFGNALVTPNGNIKAGDPDNSQGSVLSPIGQSYVRNDGGGSTDPAYAVYNGGLGSAGKFAAINFDGSAVFSQGNISFLADGGAYFGGDKGRILSDGKAFFQGNTQVAVNSSNVNGADVEGVFLGVGGVTTITVTDTGSSRVGFRVFAKGSTSNRAVIFGNGNMNLAGVLAENGSDRKFKTNIVAALSQWDDIKSLRFKTWDWNDKAPGSNERNLRRNVGLIAQEAELVDPKLVFDVQVDEVEGNTYKAIDQSVLTMKLLGALQESITRIEALEAKVTQLEGGNN